MQHLLLQCGWYSMGEKRLGEEGQIHVFTFIIWEWWGNACRWYEWKGEQRDEVRRFVKKDDDDDDNRGSVASVIAKCDWGSDEVECSDWCGINPCSACSIQIGDCRTNWWSECDQHRTVDAPRQTTTHQNMEQQIHVRKPNSAPERNQVDKGDVATCQYRVAVSCPCYSDQQRNNLGVRWWLRPISQHDTAVERLSGSFIQSPMDGSVWSPINTTRTSILWHHLSHSLYSTPLYSIWSFQYSSGWTANKTKSHQIHRPTILS